MRSPHAMNQEHGHVPLGRDPIGMPKAWMLTQPHTMSSRTTRNLQMDRGKLHAEMGPQSSDLGEHRHLLLREEAGLWGPGATGKPRDLEHKLGPIWARPMPKLINPHRASSRAMAQHGAHCASASLGHASCLKNAVLNESSRHAHGTPAAPILPSPQVASKLSFNTSSASRKRAKASWRMYVRPRLDSQNSSVA